MSLLKKGIRGGLTVIIFVLTLQGCIFDRWDKKLSQKGFSWGLIGDESTLDILYYDQGIFDKCVVGIIDLDSLLVVKAVSINKFTSLKQRNFPNKEAFFYILNYEEYTEEPHQMNSPALKGPFSYFDLVNSRTDLNFNNRKFNYW